MERPLVRGVELLLFGPVLLGGERGRGQREQEERRERCEATSHARAS